MGRSRSSGNLTLQTACLLGGYTSGYQSIDGVNGGLGNAMASTEHDGQRLRIGPPSRLRPVDQVLDDFLKDRRVQLVAHVLPISFGQHEVGVAKDAEVTRDSCPAGRELVGDLARGT